MMDHAAKARELLEMTEVMYWQGDDGQPDPTVMQYLVAAQAHATLALLDAQASNGLETQQ